MCILYIKNINFTVSALNKQSQRRYQRCRCGHGCCGYSQHSQRQQQMNHSDFCTCLQLFNFISCNRSFSINLANKHITYLASNEKVNHEIVNTT